jgi:Zn-dependent protease with chaperone function
MYQGRRCLICRGDGLCPVCRRAFDPTSTSNTVSEVRERMAAPASTMPAPAATAPTSTAPDSNVRPPSITRWSSGKLAFRALMAVVVLMAFYAFALATAAGLLFITWLQLQLATRPGGGAVVFWLLIVPPLGALAILIAIWPRFHGWVDPGRGLTKERAPELFAMLGEVARVTRQPMPRRVYLFDEVNAFVADRGMFMGRAMGLGLPLFDMLTVGELRAVVAHEFGHLASRAGGLSTFVYRSARTFATATEAAGLVPGLDILFELWTEVFLRIAMPISRQQELRADELACLVSGVDTAIAALTKVTSADEIGDPVAGWEQNTHETHPPLRDRIALARSLDLPGVLPADDRPARVLLEAR